MSREIVKKILFSSILLIFVLPFIHLEPILVILLVLTYYIGVYSFIDNQKGLYLLILLRPCLDLLTDKPVISYADFSLNLSSILGIFIVAFSSYVLLKNRKKIKEIPLKGPWILFLSITFISCFFSINMKASITEWVRILNLTSIFILGFILTNESNDLNKVIRVIIYSTIIPATFAFYQFFTKTGMSITFEGIHNRIFGTFAHPNLFAFYLVIPIILALLVFLIGDRRKVINILTIILLILMIILLALTYTRGAWLAFIIAVFFITIFKYRILFVGTLLALILSYITITPIQNRVKDLVQLNPYGSIQWRLTLWQDGLGYIKEKPLFGFGTGTANQVIFEKRGEEYGSPDPHNDYLKIALENGILGLMSYVLIIVSILYTLYKKYFEIEKPKFKILVLVIMGLTFSIYTTSFSDNIIRNTAMQWILWVLIGSTLAVLSKYKKKKNSVSS